MTQQIEVIYENGVLRPVDLPAETLQEHQRYVVRVDLPDAVPPAPQAAASLEEVRRILSRTRETAADTVRAERNER